MALLKISYDRRLANEEKKKGMKNGARSSGSLIQSGRNDERLLININQWWWWLLLLLLQLLTDDTELHIFREEEASYNIKLLPDALMTNWRDLKCNLICYLSRR